MLPFMFSMPIRRGLNFRRAFKEAGFYLSGCAASGRRMRWCLGEARTNGSTSLLRMEERREAPMVLRQEADYDLGI